MKNIFFIAVLGSMILLAACSKDEPEVNPLVGMWQLDEFAIEVKEAGFESNNTSGDASGIYKIEFRSDLTYTRTVGEGNDELVEEGNWEQDEDFIELDPQAGTPKTDGLFYDFSIEAISSRELDITFEDNWFYFPDAKVTEWIGDGTFVLNEAQTAYVFNSELTQEQINAYVTEFYTEVTEVYDLNFDLAN